MNIEEFIETIRDAIDLIEQLDEPQPLKLKDITSRMKELDSHARSEWIDVILHEFGEEFGSKKYRDGYEQGKLEGTIEHVKPVVPQCVADWYEEIKGEFYLNLHYLAWDMFESLDEDACVPKKTLNDDITRWYRKNENAIKIIVNMNQFGYEVEEEPRYTVEIKGFDDDDTFLNYNTDWDFWFLDDDGRTEEVRVAHTRKELESNGFGWVFDCEGVEVKEVE